MSASLELDTLSFALIARLRGHGHLCNVLTHIARGDWRAIENAIGSILRPRVRANDLNTIARNILELVCDDRGVTGPIMRAVFFDVAAGEIGAERTRRLKRKIACLRERVRDEARRQRAKSSGDSAPDSVAAGKFQPEEAIREGLRLSKAA